MVGQGPSPTPACITVAWPAARTCGRYWSPVAQSGGSWDQRFQFPMRGHDPDTCESGGPGGASHPHLSLQPLLFSYTVTLTHQRTSGKQDDKFDALQGPSRVKWPQPCSQALQHHGQDAAGHRGVEGDSQKDTGCYCSLVPVTC